MSFNDGFSIKGIPEPAGPVSGNVLVYNGTDWVAGTGGDIAELAAGPEYAVQFNSGSNLSGSSLLVYNYNTSTLSGTTAQFTALTGANITATTISVDTLTAREYYTELVSASIIYESGSTKFGDSLDDTHIITGSLLLTGSTHQISGTLLLKDELSGTAAQFTNLTASVISSSDSYVASLVAGGVQYPTADGENGQILVTDGVGTLNFQYPDVLIKVKNLEATQIDKGTPLYVTASGTSGNVAGVYRADAGNPARMPAACVAFEDIASDAEGTATLAGFIGGVDTSLLNSGDAVYVDVGGGYTNVRPTGSALVQPLGYVEKVGNNGSGVVRGPGHHWDLPNITPYHLWVGGANGVPTTVLSASFARTGSNTFIGDQVVTGNVDITGSLSVTGAVGVVSGDITLDDGVAGFVTTIQCVPPSVDQVISFPDATGIVALTSDLSNKVSSDTSLVSGSDQITNMVSLTQAEYDALTPVSGTFYVIVG